MCHVISHPPLPSPGSLLCFCYLFSSWSHLTHLAKLSSPSQLVPLITGSGSYSCSHTSSLSHPPLPLCYFLCLKCFPSPPLFFHEVFVFCSSGVGCQEKMPFKNKLSVILRTDVLRAHQDTYCSGQWAPEKVPHLLY